MCKLLMITELLVEEVCYPALPCKLAAVVIHRMLLVKEAIPALSCKLAVMIHRMSGRMCYPALHASCCCDSQNALVQEGCAALSCMLLL
jgi:hypothetical protein